MIYDRYKYSKIVDNKYYSRPDYYNINPNDYAYKYIQITTKYGDRLDHLASKYFQGNAKLWWIIALINNLNGDSYAIPTGTILYIPKNYREFI